jgi:hypothetical protein
MLFVADCGAVGRARTTILGSKSLTAQCKSEKRIMSTTIDQGTTNGGDLPQQIRGALAVYCGPSLRHVEILTREGAILLRGSVSSFYAKQILQHSAQRAAGSLPIIDEVEVVAPAALRDPERLRRAAAAGLALSLLLVVAGCGSSADAQRVAVHPVSGEVTFNGKPAAGAFVVFHSKQGDASFPAPRAYVDPQGRFSLSTYDGGDGAPVGEYAVTLVLEPQIKKDGEYVQGANVLPPKYSKPRTTTVVARVAEGTNTVPIKIAR